MASTTTTPAAETILYVSTTGSNANPCTLAQPCRSLQGGINKTPAGGELHILDSGFYGNFGKIRKSMTISGNGHTITLNNPITINKAAATVVLRRLVLNGEGSTTFGIDITTATAVHIEHCVIYSFISAGIRLNVTTITRTVSSANLGTSIYVAGGRMNVTSSTSANNDHGFVTATGAQLLLGSSVARGNSSNGLWAFDGTMTISNSVIANNITGINKDGAATVQTRLNNTVTGNGTEPSAR